MFGTLILFLVDTDQASPLGIDDLLGLLLSQADCEFLSFLHGIIEGSYRENELVKDERVE
jgi:hypothetical protein